MTRVLRSESSGGRPVTAVVLRETAILTVLLLPMESVMPEKLPHVRWLFIAACLFLVLPGCGNSPKSKYDKIKLGMTVDEVQALMGRKPDADHTNPSSWMDPKDLTLPPQLIWVEDGGLGIGVVIEDGRVTQKTLSKTTIVDGKAEDFEVLEQEPVR